MNINSNVRETAGDALPDMPFSQDEVVAAFPEFTVITPHVGKGVQKVAYRTIRDSSDVALKIILWDAETDDSENDPSAERFRRELQGMASTSCPHLIQVLDGPETREIGGSLHFWYTEPFLSGGTLQDRFAAGRLTAQEVHELARCLLSAVESMWNEGQFVHRDIKPGNIGYLEDGTVVLFDLGIALFTEMSPITQSSLSGPGTNLYAAPEQFEARRFATIDFRTDLFQIGIVLVEALTGKHPFFLQGTNYYERLVSFDPSTLDGVETTAGLRNLIPRLLAPRPNGRFRKVSMAIEALEGVG